MRTMTMSLFLIALTACLPSKVDDGGSDTVADTEETVEPTSTWVEVTNGYCWVLSSLDSGATWSDLGDTVNVSSNDEPVMFVGDPGALLQVKCDATVVPLKAPPSVNFDPLGCPRVYCNPWGGTNRSAGEDEEECGENLWAYIYPSSEGYGTTLPDDECGPWNLVDE